MKKTSPVWSGVSLALLALNLLCPFVVSFRPAPPDGPDLGLMVTHHYFQLAALALIWWSGQDRRIYFHLSLLTLAMLALGAAGLFSPVTMQGVWALTGLAAVAAAARLPLEPPRPEAADSALKLKILAAIPALLHFGLTGLFGLLAILSLPGTTFGPMPAVTLTFSLLPGLLLAASRRRSDLLSLAALGGAVLLAADLWIVLAAFGEGRETAVYRLVAAWVLGLPLNQLLAQAAVLAGVLILVYRRIGESSAFGDEPPPPPPVFNPVRRAVLLWSAGAALAALFLGAGYYFNRSEIEPKNMAVPLEPYRVGPVEVRLPAGLEISAWGVSLIRDDQRVWLKELPLADLTQAGEELWKILENSAAPGSFASGESLRFDAFKARSGVAGVALKTFFDPGQVADHDQSPPAEGPPNQLQLTAVLYGSGGLLTLTQQMPLPPGPPDSPALKEFRSRERDLFLAWCQGFVNDYQWLTDSLPVQPEGLKTEHGLIQARREAGVTVWLRHPQDLYVVGP